MREQRERESKEEGGGWRGRDINEDNGDMAGLPVKLKGGGDRDLWMHVYVMVTAPFVGVLSSVVPPSREETK